MSPKAKTETPPEFSVPRLQAKRWITVQGHEVGYTVKYNSSTEEVVTRAFSTHKEAIDLVTAYLNLRADDGD